MTALDLITGSIATQLIANGAPVQMAGLDAVNATVRLLSNQMMQANADLVKSKVQLDVVATEDTVTLPSNFGGFISHPVALSSKRPLVAVTEDMRTAYLGASGPPVCYEIFGPSLYLFPIPTANDTLYCECWTLPADLALTSALPFAGLLNDIIADLALKAIVGGPSVLASSGFLAEVDLLLEKVLLQRKPPLPARRPIQFF